MVKKTTHSKTKRQVSTKNGSDGGGSSTRRHEKGIHKKGHGGDDDDDDTEFDRVLSSIEDSNYNMTTIDSIKNKIWNITGELLLETSKSTTTTSSKKNKSKNNNLPSLTWKSYVGPCIAVVILSIVFDQRNVEWMSVDNSGGGSKSNLLNRWIIKSMSFLGLESTFSSLSSSPPSFSFDTNHHVNESYSSSYTSLESDDNINDSTLHNLIRLFNLDRSMYAVDRTVYAATGGRGIDAHQKVLDVSREDQIWTLDALRSFQSHPVYQLVLQAHHVKTDNPLAPQAHLALYIALLKKQQQQEKSVVTETTLDNTTMDDEPTNGPIADLTTLNKEMMLDVSLTSKQKIYLDLLPTYQDFDGVHPVTFSLRTLNSKFGSQTNMYFLVAKRKAEIESEYKALKASIQDTTKDGQQQTYRLPISYQDYIAARLVVQTRGFQAGPMEDGLMTDQLGQDMELYRTTYNVPNGQKIFCTAMVPILDALNHHHKDHNVEWKYVPGSHNFVAYSSRYISPGGELHDTYGDRADLFATYGFVNGDLSERTSALMAAHTIVDTRVVPPAMYERDQKSEILRYLQHDDGYLECVNEVSNEDGMEMKRLKRQAILLLANIHRIWIVSFPARDLDPHSGSVPIDDGMAQIVNTARLMALTHRDYDGAAPTMLEDIISSLEETSNPTEFRFTLDKGDDGLEYRTMVWLWRFAAFNLEKYKGVVSGDELANMEELEVNTKEWYTAYVRYQELIALETIKAYADQNMGQYATTLHGNPDLKEDFFFRADLCPIDSKGLYALVNS